MRSLLRRLKIRLRAAKDDRGATDPILVIAAIAVSLVLLVGGSFAVAGIITNGKNLNAKSDLSKISVAEAAAFAQSDQFLSYVITSKGVETGTTGYPLLSKSGVGFTATAGDPLAVTGIAADSTVSPAVPAGWIAATKSASGTIYFASSTTALISTSAANVGISSADAATMVGQLK